jgi:hypothetical protein
MTSNKPSGEISSVLGLGPVDKGLSGDISVETLAISFDSSSYLFGVTPFLSSFTTVPIEFVSLISAVIFLKSRCFKFKQVVRQNSV